METSPYSLKLLLYLFKLFTNWMKIMTNTLNNTAYMIPERFCYFWCKLNL